MLYISTLCFDAHVRVNVYIIQHESKNHRSLLLFQFHFPFFCHFIVQCSCNYRLPKDMRSQLAFTKWNTAHSEHRVAFLNKANAVSPLNCLRSIEMAVILPCHFQECKCITLERGTLTKIASFKIKPVMTWICWRRLLVVFLCVVAENVVTDTQTDRQTHTNQVPWP